MKSGIIKITNTANEYIYIGYSYNAEHRIDKYKSSLKRGDFRNKYLQADWDRQRGEGFEFEVIEACGEHELVERKQYYMDVLQPTYNIIEKSFESNKDIPRSESAKRNFKESIRKLKESGIYNEIWSKRSENPKWRKNVAEKNKELAKNPEWIKAHKDGIKKRPKDWRENVTKAARKRSENPEWRKNNMEGIRRRSKNPEWRKKNAEAMKKLNENPEIRKKAAKTRKGLVENPEWRKAISNGVKRYYAQKKAAEQSVNPTETSSREK